MAAAWISVDWGRSLGRRNLKSPLPAAAGLVIFAVGSPRVLCFFLFRPVPFSFLSLFTQLFLYHIVYFFQYQFWVYWIYLLNFPPENQESRAPAINRSVKFTVPI